MNLNEVEKHVKFDLIFQLLIYIAIGLCLLLSLIVILATPAKAETISVNLTNNGVSAGQNCINHPLNAFCTSQMVQDSSTNACGNGDAKCNMYMAYGTENNVYSLNFVVNTSFHANSKVTITLKGPYFANATYGCTTNVGTANNLGCRAIRTSSTSMNINFTTNSSPLTYADFDVYISSGNGFNPNKFFNITSVVLYETPIEDSSSSSFDDSGIINNANQNTSDIIQNQDSNAQDTQNVIINSAGSIIKELADRCPNLLDLIQYDNYTLNGVTFDVSDGVITLNGTSTTSFGISFTNLMTISQGKYILYAEFGGSKTGSNSFYLYNYQTNTSPSGGLDPDFTQQTFNLVSEISNTAFDTYINSGITFNNYTIKPMLITGFDKKPFCPFGSNLSKLDVISGEIGGVYGGIQSANDKIDDLNDTSQQTYDYLTDDTDPEVDSEGIEDVLGEVEISDPLNYLLTLPLNLLRKLNQVLSTNTCSRVSFGQLYGTELYLPCIDFSEILGSNIWNTVDLIVGVGLLAIILKRFYDSISNVLTLGKEKEVRDKLDLPTPMQFLASILGGGSD